MKVSSISIDSGIMCIAHVPENDCYPIPLNRDILLKCGFGEVGMYENVYHKDNIRIHLDKSGETGTALFIQYNDDESIFSKEVSSLHQLQNLHFALSGKELECTI